MDKRNGSKCGSSLIDKSSFMWKVFSALLNNEDFPASDEDLVNFCVKELNVTLGSLPPLLIDNLPAIVVAYMNMWSGWHSKSDFLLGKIQIDFYFERFQKYLGLKIKSLNKSEAAQRDFVMHLYAMKKQEQQKPFLPFALSIQCPARILNTLVFADDGGVYEAFALTFSISTAYA